MCLMQNFLTYGFYVALVATFAVLVIGVVGLIRHNPVEGKKISRSNQLMRLRVLLQFIAVIFLVGIGLVAGVFSGN